MTSSRLLRLATSTLLCAAALPALASSPAPANTDCGGLPRLDVKTPPGFCLAVLGAGFKFPRGVLPLPNGDLIVVDMGGWVADRGTLYLLKRGASGYDKTVLMKGLDRPNGIAMGPDGMVYVGALKRIFRFDPAKPAAPVTDVIGGASKVSPLPGIGRHLLTAMRFDLKGDLYVNVGSGTDHCEGADGAPVSKPCHEGEGDEGLGLIRKYEMEWPAGSVKRWEVFARGLRNSMALAVHPATGELWQGENSRDAMNAAMPELKNDDDLPHDELNLVKRGSHYGWPYCYDNNLASPEYPGTDCSAYKMPAMLLPGHAAPLGMTFYTATLFPALYHNSLIVGFHGYRSHGHRIVAILPDKAGAPLGKMVDLVSDWNRKGKQGMGAPVDIELGPDGNIYLADDRNGMVLRLQYTAKP